MSQWIISNSFIEEISLGLKGKRLWLAKGHIGQVLLDWTEKIKNFLTMKLKRGGDTWLKQLCQRSVDEIVRLQAGWFVGKEELVTDFLVANVTK